MEDYKRRITGNRSRSRELREVYFYFTINNFPTHNKQLHHQHPLCQFVRELLRSSDNAKNQIWKPGYYQFSTLIFNLLAGICPWEVEYIYQYII